VQHVDGDVFEALAADEDDDGDIEAAFADEGDQRGGPALRATFAQSTTTQPTAASVRMMSSASSMRRARSEAKPTRSISSVICSRRSPSMSPGSKAGAQIRNLNRRSNCMVGDSGNPGSDTHS